MEVTGGCFFCGRSGVWCDLCKAYLCPDHRMDYLRRMQQAASHPADTGKKVIDYLMGR